MKQFVRSNNGLTLLEVIFSMSILALVLLSLMITFPKMKMLVNKSQCKVAAIKACQTKMEALREGGFSNLPSAASTPMYDYSIVLDQGADQDSSADDTPCDISTTIFEVDSGGVIIAKKIIIQCTWIENNTECSEYLDCVMYNNTIE